MRTPTELLFRGVAIPAEHLDSVLREATCTQETVERGAAHVEAYRRDPMGGPIAGKVIKGQEFQRWLAAASTLPTIGGNGLPTELVEIPKVPRTLDLGRGFSPPVLMLLVGFPARFAFLIRRPSGILAAGLAKTRSFAFCAHASLPLPSTLASAFLGRTSNLYWCAHEYRLSRRCDTLAEVRGGTAGGNWSRGKSYRPKVVWGYEVAA